MYSHAVFFHEFSKQSSVLKSKIQSTLLKFCRLTSESCMTKQHFILQVIYQTPKGISSPFSFIFHKGTTPYHHSFHLLNILPKKSFTLSALFPQHYLSSFLGHRFIWKKFRGRKPRGTTFFPLFRCEKAHFLLKLSLLCSLKAGDLSRYRDLS